MSDDLLVDNAETTSVQSESNDALVIINSRRAQEETQGGRIAVLIPPAGRYLMLLQLLVTIIFYIGTHTLHLFVDDLCDPCPVDLVLLAVILIAPLAILSTTLKTGVTLLMIGLATVGAISIALPATVEVFRGWFAIILVEFFAVVFLFSLWSMGVPIPCLLGLQLGDGPPHVFGTAFRMLYFFFILGRLIGDIIGWSLGDRYSLGAFIILALCICTGFVVSGVSGKLENEFVPNRPQRLETLTRHIGVMPIVFLGIATLYFGMGIVEDDRGWVEKRWMLWIPDGCAIIFIPLLERYLFSRLSDEHFISMPTGRIPLGIFLVGVLCIVAGGLVVARSGSLLTVTVPLFVILSVAEFLFVTATWEYLFRRMPVHWVFNSFRAFYLSALSGFPLLVLTNPTSILWFLIVTGVFLLIVSLHQAGHVYESVVDSLDDQYELAPQAS